MSLQTRQSWIVEQLRQNVQKDLLRSRKPSSTCSTGRISIDGQQLWNFASNDYLSLASDPRLVESANKAAQDLGWGASASPLITGWSPEHERLATELATFLNAPACLLFPTGFAANLGAIAALADRADVIYVDRLNHACLIDGARLSGASVRPYRHADAEHLARILKRERARYRRAIIVTDSVFSMDGDVAPLTDLADLADDYDTMLVVDEAHATGLLGTEGQGACQEAGIEDRVDLHIGTCSKALGSQGGFVTGSEAVITWLTQSAKTFVYSTASPPAVVAATRMGLAISRSEPWRRRQVLAIASRIRQALTDLGLPIPANSQGPIIPVLVGEASRALRLSSALGDLGYYVPAIRPPTVPRETSRLRLSVAAGLPENAIDGLIAAFAQILRDP